MPLQMVVSVNVKDAYYLIQLSGKLAGLNINFITTGAALPT